MILLDANVLLYAYDQDCEQHEAARTWLEEALGAGRPLRLSWFVVVAFIRIATDPRVYRRPKAMAEAVQVIDDLLAQPTVSVLDPGDDHWAVFSRLLGASQVRGAIVTDAHLAALAVEHGASLCTTDRDFRRFDGLKLQHPFEASR